MSTLCEGLVGGVGLPAYHTSISFLFFLLLNEVDIDKERGAPFLENVPQRVGLFFFSVD